MEFALLLLHYILWHYTKAIADIAGVVRNFLWFVYNFFSLPILLHTFFSPWKRMTERYEKGITPFFSALLINTLMRIVGMFFRSCVLIIGCVAFLLTFFLGLGAFCLWLLSPFLLLWLMGKGIEELILYLSL